MKPCPTGLATVKAGCTYLPGVHHLVGTAEIAEMLGVTRQRVHQLTSRPDFPSPTVVLAGGSIWERQAVIEWIDQRGRALGITDT